MSSQFHALGIVIAVAVATIGCAQPPSTRMQPQASADQDPSDSAAARVVESSVRQTGYHHGDELPAGPRISLTVQVVEFQDQPDVHAALDSLWTNAGEARSRTMPTAEIDAAMQSLVKNGLARISVPSAMQLASGEPGQWQDAAQWTGTATIGDTKAIQVSLTGWSLNQPADAPPDRGWRTNTAAELHPGETLVVEGPESYMQVMEISRRPILGDLPIVGRLFFTNKRSTMDIQKTLYLVTAEHLSAADTNSGNSLTR